LSEKEDEEYDKFERRQEKLRFLVIIVMGILGFLSGFAILYNVKETINIILQSAFILFFELICFIAVLSVLYIIEK